MSCQRKRKLNKRNKHKLTQTNEKKNAAIFEAQIKSIETDGVYHKSIISHTK